jgi:hypothetical protein
MLRFGAQCASGCGSSREERENGEFGCSVTKLMFDDLILLLLLKTACLIVFSTLFRLQSDSGVQMIPAIHVSNAALHDASVGTNSITCNAVTVTVCSRIQLSPVLPFPSIAIITIILYLTFQLKFHIHHGEVSHASCFKFVT